MLLCTVSKYQIHGGAWTQNSKHWYSGSEVQQVLQQGQSIPSLPQMLTANLLSGASRAQTASTPPDILFSDKNRFSATSEDENYVRNDNMG